MDNTIRLKDACKILNGFAFKSSKYVDSGIRIIRIANVQKGYVEDEKPAFYPDSEEPLIRDYMLEENDLLLSLTGNVGRVALLDKKWLPAALNQRVACLRIKDDRIIKDYLYFALLSDKFENDCIKSSKGIAQKNMSTEWLKDYEIPLPSEQRQREIVSSLKHLSAIIKNKTEQVRQLDNLIKARFVEMFDDTDSERVKIAELVEQKIPTAKKDFESDAEIKYIDISSIDNKRNIMTGFTKYKMSNAPSRAQQHVQFGDILISTVRPNLKNVAMVSLDSDNLVASSGFCVLRSKKCTPEFLMAIVCSDKFTDAMINVVTGANYPAIKNSDVLNYCVPLPSEEQQRNFSNFVTQVDKSKFAVQKSLEKTQLLFDSLMQEYFG